MQKHMSLPSRREYLKRLKPRYLKASIEKKTMLLDECCKMTGLNRKYLIVVLSAATDLEYKSTRQRKARKEIYDKRFVVVLKKIWEIMDYPCGARLKPVLSEMVEKLVAFKELTVSQEMEKKLIDVSRSTIDAKLKRSRVEIRRRIQGTTKPGSLLKHQIPIRTSSWEESRPGFCELDTVAHCGDSAAGEFANTLDVTDILTGWTEQEVFLGKAQKRVIAGLSSIKERLPFPLLGIDPDNGSEFINWQMYRFCTDAHVEFTRGRPYKKNDNAHIEQKNWTHVRQVYGYERIEEQEIVDLMNDLNRNELRLYKNFFQPTMKLIDKKRVGLHKEKIKRIYDVPKTPYQRVLLCDVISPETKQALTTLYVTLNPAYLKRTILKKLAVIKKRNTILRKTSKHQG
ncbi:MAG: transposase [Patescibacteria group bacterium]|nr:transposase [Patescibacteria group bacterium]